MKSILGKSAHSRILYAYLARLTPAHIDEIRDAALAAQRAALNEGMRGQIEAQQNMMLATLTAVGLMSDYDRGLVDEVIRRNLANPDREDTYTKGPVSDGGMDPRDRPNC